MKIKACEKHLGMCNYTCCSFQDNYIVLYPDELETTRLNTEHLKIIDDNYHGGKKAICLKPCTEKDFKPFDCEIYPYFLHMSETGEVKFLKGKKCPLKKKELIHHKKDCLNKFKKLIKNQKIFEWQRNLELIGYEIE